VHLELKWLLRIFLISTPQRMCTVGEGGYTTGGEMCEGLRWGNWTEVITWKI